MIRGESVVIVALIGLVLVVMGALMLARVRRRAKWITPGPRPGPTAGRVGLALMAAGLAAIGWAVSQLALSPHASPARAALPPPTLGPDQPGPEDRALADLSSAATGSEVDGIPCQASPPTQTQLSTHLSVLIDGVPGTIPAGIGFVNPVTSTDGSVTGGMCRYWVHVDGPDGIIHIESPPGLGVSLGTLFDIWGQRLGPTHVARALGPVTAYRNGQRFDGDPATIALGDHVVVQLDVGTDTPPLPYTFPPGG